MAETKHSKRGRKFTDQAGKRYGRLVVQRLNKIEKSTSFWECLCDCGKTNIVRIWNLLSGGTTSCGCYGKEQRRKALTKHGMSRTQTYHSYRRMLSRCTNLKDDSYGDYGGRGIGVCLRWYMSFENFYADMGDPPTPKHTLDRINNDGHYTPDNCRWATWKEQIRNGRHHKHFLTFRGETRNVTDWAEVIGIKKSALSERLRAGWSIKKALTTPSNGLKRQRDVYGKYLPCVSDLSKRG